MCVIMLADSSRLTDEMVELGFEANKDGTGIAWREEGLVKWRKGIDFAEAQDLARSLPLPYVLHFRIQTVGGCSQALCHPFPVTEGAELALSGTTDGEVLFHNGHWHSWKQMVYDVAARRNVKLPGGKWSDTRAMAWMASQLGIGVLEMIGEKALVLGVEEINIYGSWDVVDDCWISNTHWKRKAWTNVESRKTTGFLNTETASGCESGNYYDYDRKSVSAADRTKPRELPPLKQVGGPATEATFRAGEESMAAGTHLQGGVEAGTAEGRQGKEEGPAEDAQGGRAPLNGRPDTSLILLPGEEVIDDIVWVRSLNPKRRHAQQIINVDTQREVRMAANAEGKQIIGPL